jgi:hypothetical protein
VSVLSDSVLDASEFGCCVTRMNVCHCHEHVDEAGKKIARNLRKILTEADAATMLVLYIDMLEKAV